MLVQDTLAPSTDPSSVAISIMAQAVAAQVTAILKLELSKLGGPTVQPTLLDVKQAAIYLGRTEQAVQHLIFQRDIPVVRTGKRVHLHRPDLDSWIERNKE